MNDFQSHLQEKGKTIKTKAESLLSRVSSQRDALTPEAASLEGKVNNLLAAQKEYMLKLDRLNSEKDQLSEQLNAATLRYFKAEKKLDRAKSAQVQKMEQQAFSNATRPTGAAGAATIAVGVAPTEGSSDQQEVNGTADELLLKYEELSASAAKQKEQLDSIFSELKSLQDENSTLRSRRETLTDEDFIRTDVFKQFKAQNEDLIKRINNLEATNKQLREEGEKLQAERTAYKNHLEAEANQVAQELEAEIVLRDQDLARVRSARDEILAENTQRKASMEQDRTSIEHIKDLLSAKDDRIAALESQMSHLEPTGDQEAYEDDTEELSSDELQQRYRKLRKDFQSINQELPSIEKAYKKMKDLAQKKVLDFVALEDKVSLLIAEKSKADQKYFAARKDADTRNNEIKSLRHQNSKSAEIIAQLKDLEAQSRLLLGNLEKQVNDLKQSNATLTAENKKMESTSLEAVRRSDSLARQISELTSLVKSRDSASAAVRERSTNTEAEVEKLKVRIEHAQKDRDNWKSKALSNSSEEEEMLRVSYSPSCLNTVVGRLFTFEHGLTTCNRHLRCAQFAATTSRTRR